VINIGHEVLHEMQIVGHSDKEAADDEIDEYLAKSSDNSHSAGQFVAQHQNGQPAVPVGQ
jgi:hypothetical protein